MDTKVVVKSGKDEFYVNQCVNIAKENYNCGYGDENRIKASKYLICAVKDEEVVGFIGLREEELRSAPVYITELSVKKDFQKQGIGSMLLEYLKTHSKNYSVIIVVNYRQCQELENLYLKHGFMLKRNFEQKRINFYPNRNDEKNEYLQISDEIEKE